MTKKDIITVIFLDLFIYVVLRIIYNLWVKFIIVTPYEQWHIGYKMLDIVVFLITLFGSTILAKDIFNWYKERKNER